MLAQTNAGLERKAADLAAALQQESDARRKRDEDLKSMERVVATFDGIRGQLEAQRGELQNKLAKAEATARELHDKLELALRARASPVPTNPTEATAALKAHADILEEEVARLQKELDVSITEASAAKHDASMKSIDLEVKEAQEAYLKVRIENMEADVASKDAVIQTKTLQVAELSAVAQQLQYQLQLQLQLQAQAQAQMQAYVAATQASHANLAHSAPETKSEVLPESVGPVNHIKLIPDSGSRAEMDMASVDVASLDVASLDDALAERRVASTAAQNGTGARTSVTETARQPAPTGTDDGKDDNEDHGESDSDASTEEEDVVWLFALASSERDRFAQEMGFTPGQVTVLETVHKLSEWVHGDLKRFYENPEPADVLSKLEPWTEAYCESLRDVLVQVCERDVCIILCVGGVRDAGSGGGGGGKANNHNAGESNEVDDRETRRREMLFASAVADAYDSAEDPGKVVLGLEDWKQAQTPLEPTVDQDGPVPDISHDIVSFATWSQSPPAQ